MKLKICFIIVTIFIMTAGAIFAAPPREQLKQMVEQLQKSPTDNALREKIIKLAQTIKPAPTVPTEAEKFEGRAQFAFSYAKSTSDYLDAAKEYEKAIEAAPWVTGYYSDLCTIYEKTEKYAEAKKNCEFFLVGSPSAQDASDVRKRIAGLEFAMEKAAKQKNQGEEWLKKLDGARFVRRGRDKFNDGGWQDWMMIYEVRKNKIFSGYMIIANDGSDEYKREQRGKMHWDYEYLINGYEFVIPKDDQQCKDFQQRCLDEPQGISEDGRKIIGRRTYRGKLEEQVYLRE